MKKALKFIPCLVLAAAAPLAATPVAGHAYAVYGPQLVIINLESELYELSVVGDLDLDARELAFGAGDELYGLDADNGQLLRIDAETAAVEVVGAFGADAFGETERLRGLTFDARGRLWLLSREPGTEISRLYRADPATGAVISSVELSEPIDAIASWHGSIYGARRGSVSTIDPALGTVTQLHELSHEGTWLGASFDTEGRLWLNAYGERSIPGPPIPNLVLRLDIESGESLRRSWDIGIVAAAIPDFAHHLQDGRFRVTTKWRTAEDECIGHPTPLTGESGLFWFFDEQNIELIVKVLDACDHPDFESFWVFAAGLTNVEVELTVTDTLTGVDRQYSNPLGTPFQPLLDTAAFPTCSP